MRGEVLRAGAGADCPPGAMRSALSREPVDDQHRAHHADGEDDNRLDHHHLLSLHGGRRSAPCRRLPERTPPPRAPSWPPTC